MDFLQSRIQQESIHTAFTYSTDGLEDEDDAFYSELRRQVLQLTEEYDHGDLYENKNINTMNEARKHGPIDGPRDKCYYDWPGNKEDCVTPPWMLNLWRTGNGTGVFIPQVVPSRRKYRPRRKNEGGRTYKRVEKIK